MFNKIFFDFDSTLITVESLDLLADACGVGPEARAMTERSMNGEVPIEAVFKKKIDLIAPSRIHVEEVAQACMTRLSRGAEEIMRALALLGKERFILSSNFREIIRPTARLLGIAESHSIGNEFHFDAGGAYLGFTDSSPLCRQGGKGTILRTYLKPGDVSAFIGDGSTDIVAKNVADLFIGYGGVTARPLVEAHADIFIKEPSLMPVLQYVCTPEERRKIKNSMGVGHPYY